MPRPQSPCGTYPAYRRHLRERTRVDDACRRAQQDHDAARGRTGRLQDAEPVRTLPVPVISALAKRGDELRARYRKGLSDLVTLVDEGDMYGVIDLEHELADLLDEWVDTRDHLEYERGYPDLSEELRANLLESERARLGPRASD